MSHLDDLLRKNARLYRGRTKGNHGFTRKNLRELLKGYSASPKIHFGNIDEFLKASKGLSITPTANTLFSSVGSYGDSPYQVHVIDGEIWYPEGQPNLEGLTLDDFSNFFKKNEMLSQPSPRFYLGYVKPYKKSNFQNFYVFEDGQPIQLPKGFAWAGPLDLPSLFPYGNKEFDKLKNSFDLPIFDDRYGLENTEMNVYPLCWSINPFRIWEYGDEDEGENQGEENYYSLTDNRILQDCCLVYHIYLDEDMNSVTRTGGYRYILKILFDYETVANQGKWTISSNVMFDAKKNKLV